MDSGTYKSSEPDDFGDGVAGVAAEPGTTKTVGAVGVVGPGLGAGVGATGAVVCGFGCGCGMPDGKNLLVSGGGIRGSTGGVAEGIKTTRDMPRCSATDRATIKCPLWMGLKVPPNSAIPLLKTTPFQSAKSA